MLISPGNALAASLPRVTLGQAPRPGLLMLTHKMDPLIRADAHAEPSGLLSGVTCCISAPGRPRVGGVIHSLSCGPDARGSPAWLFEAGHAQLQPESQCAEPLLWQQVCPFPGATSPAHEQLAWLVRESVLCLQGSLPLHPLLRQQELYTQCRAGWESLLHFQSLGAMGAEGRRGSTHGAAFAEPPAQWPGPPWGPGAALPLRVCGCLSCLFWPLTHLICPLLF